MGCRVRAKAVRCDAWRGFGAETKKGGSLAAAFRM